MLTRDKNGDFFHTLLALLSPCWSIAISFGTEKLEWYGYQTLQKV